MKNSNFLFQIVYWQIAAQSGRAETSCDQEWCGYPMKTNWSSSIAFDFHVFDKYVESYDRASEYELKLFKYWSQLCGDLCCPWRKSQGTGWSNTFPHLVVCHLVSHNQT